MYKITCDGYPILDTSVDDLIVANPKANVEANTIGDCSFVIYSNHPYYDKLKKMKSIFEVSDEYGVILRGRMTNDSADFDNAKAVDIEGAMGFFNDSIVRPFDFPHDDKFDQNRYDYEQSQGNVVAYFLEWLIEQHNEQVEEFQRFKLGNVDKALAVAVAHDLQRSDTEYKKTWTILKEKLFGSSLGGYLCVRYEADGNYIDYLSKFAETNEQAIAYGENLLDIKRESDATQSFSVIVPLGAEIEYSVYGGDSGIDIIPVSERLTLNGFPNGFEVVENEDETTTIVPMPQKGIPDGDITDDLVKRGDCIYSRSAVEKIGWVCAPPEDSTFDDIHNDNFLLDRAIKKMEQAGAYTETVEFSAVDLHLTDSQIRSFRIYKQVNATSVAHNLSGEYPLEKLSLDLLNPQNTKIAVSRSYKTMSELQINQSAVIKNIASNYATNQKLTNTVTKMSSMIEQTEKHIKMEVTQDFVSQDEFGAYQGSVAAKFELTIGKNDKDQVVSMINAVANQVTITSDNFKLTADGTITATAGTIGGNLKVGGRITIGEGSSYYIDTGTNDIYLSLPGMTVSEDEGLVCNLGKVGGFKADGTKLSCGNKDYLFPPGYTDAWLQAETGLCIYSGSESVGNGVGGISIGTYNTTTGTHYEQYMYAGRHDILGESSSGNNVGLNLGAGKIVFRWANNTNLQPGDDSTGYQGKIEADDGGVYVSGEWYFNDNIYYKGMSLSTWITRVNTALGIS